MKILLVGGGSGGHVTPVKAIARELLKELPQSDLRIICDRGFAERARSLFTDMPVKIDVIHSGKFRRYHSLSIFEQIRRLDVLRNIRDTLWIFLGTLQSIVKLIRWRPDVVFCKGGFVCVPVAIAAGILGVPIVMHDSDAHTGLANRIISHWAKRILTGAPLDFYSYPAAKSRYVGTPIDNRFNDDYDIAHEKEALDLDPKRPVIVVTGGGLGAVAINNAVASLGEEWCANGWQVYHVAGQGNEKELRDQFKDTPSYKVVAFETNMLGVLRAADVVIARAGATTLLELAALKKPTIIVPNPYLTGGHQTKNAAVYAREDAAIVIAEDLVAAELGDAVSLLLTDSKHAEVMAIKMHAMVRLHAAEDVAEEIKKVGSKH